MIQNCLKTFLMNNLNETFEEIFNIELTVPVVIEHEDTECPLANTRLWAYHEVTKFTHFDVSDTKVGQTFQRCLEENIQNDVKDTIDLEHYSQEEFEDREQEIFEDYEVKVRYVIDIYYDDDIEEFFIEGQRQLSTCYHDPISDVLFTKTASEMFQQGIHYTNFY